MNLKDMIQKKRSRHGKAKSLATKTSEQSFEDYELEGDSSFRFAHLSQRGVRGTPNKTSSLFNAYPKPSNPFLKTDFKGLL